MSARIFAACGAAASIAALACAGGSVSRYAPCGATDTCPSATTCEAVSQLTLSALGSLCTWSCNNDDFDPQTCPNDSNGNAGVCAGTVAGEPIGEGSFGLCFQFCVTNDACAPGSACVDAQLYGTQSQTKVCAPVPPDSIASTTWQSATITPTAKSNGVQTSTYTMSFGAQNGFDSGLAQGSFTATLVQVYSTTPSYTYAGCTETTTYLGGTWNDRAPTPQQPGNLGITNTTSHTDRTGCADSLANTKGEADDYDLSNGVAGYYLADSNTTMNLGGGYGSLPYDDSVEWTFTKQ